MGQWLAPSVRPDRPSPRRQSGELTEPRQQLAIGVPRRGLTADNAGALVMRVR